MGNCLSSDASPPSPAPAPGASPPAGYGYQAPSPRFNSVTSSGTNPGSVASGGRLGGDTVVASLGPRTAAALAAEARAAARAPQEDRLRREDLIGKIHEASRRRGKEVPLSLGSWPLAQLAAHYESLSAARARVD